MTTPSLPSPFKRILRLARLLAIALRVIRRTPGLTVRRVVVFAWKGRKILRLVGRARLAAAPGGVLVLAVVVARRVRRRRHAAAEVSIPYSPSTANGNGAVPSPAPGPGTRNAGLEAAATTQTERRLEAEKAGSAELDAPNESAPGDVIPPAPAESDLHTPASHGEPDGPNESAPGDAIPPAP
jgi:hypothetical protein